MGARGHLLVALALCTALVGCFEFEEPDLPEAGAPAILQAAIHVDDAAQLHFTATLAPALTLEGLQREIPNDTIVVNGLRTVPIEYKRNGTREYDFRSAQPDANTRPLSIVPPRIEAVQAPPPVVQWPTIQRLDGDSILLPAGRELLLRLRRVGTEVPAPQTRSWALDLVSAESNFRIGGGGAPPDSIRIPPQFIPAAQNGRISAVLTYFQSGVYRPAPGDYLMNLTADVRVRWLIRLTGS